jgi:hypothetical protein
MPVCHEILENHLFDPNLWALMRQRKKLNDLWAEFSDALCYQIAK